MKNSRSQARGFQGDAIPDSATCRTLSCNCASRTTIPSPQRIHLDSKGEGVFHIGFEVRDADAGRNQGANRRLSVLMRGRRENRTGFTYYDTADKAGVILLTRATNPLK
jgi:hypothetical protein